MKTRTKFLFAMILASAFSFEAVHAAEPGASISQKKDGFEFEQDLLRYGRLKSKIFLTERERADKAAMESNRELLKDLGRFLSQPSYLGSRRGKMQNAAVDLLMTSLKSHPGGGVAIDALTEIVKNASIEKSEGWFIDDERRSVAGFKGEVLYLWSTAQPEQANVIASLLPGPVSQKIWQNVLKLQSENSHLSSVLPESRGLAVQ